MLNRTAVTGKALAYLMLASALAVLMPPGVGLTILGFAAVALVTPTLCLTDIRELRLPNRITLPLMSLTLGALTLDQLLSPHPQILTALMLSLVILLALFITSLFGGLGMGDVKLAVSLTLCLAALGKWWPVIGIGLAFGLAALGILAACSRFFRMRTIPFGPFMLIAFWLATGLWCLEDWSGGWVSAAAGFPLS